MNIFQLLKNNEIVVVSCQLQDIINTLATNNIVVNCIEELFVSKIMQNYVLEVVEV